MDGEEAGPSYGAVNGVPPPQSRTGGLQAGSGSEREQADVPSSSSANAQQNAPEPAMPMAPPAVNVSDAPVCSSEALGSAQHVQARSAHTATAQQPQQQRPMLPSPRSTQASLTLPPRPSTSSVGDRLPPPLQHAVQQLSQQRTAVIQAVQTRAQRALQGRRVDEVVGEGNIFASTESLAGSPQVVQDAEHESERGASAWSVTRISEVLHRRIVAPMMGQGAADPPPTPSWQSPVNQSAPVEPPLMSPESRRAMAAWTARPSILTTPVVPDKPQNDDSSAASVNHDLVMEEVRKQVQLAMQGRDSELHALKTQNEELRRALDTSAQLLNDMVQAGGKELGSQPQEAQRGAPGCEPGRTSRGESERVRQVPGAPPGLAGPAEQPGGIPVGDGLGEPAREGIPRELPGHSRLTGGIRDTAATGQELGGGNPGPLSGDRVQRATTDLEAEASPLD